MDKYRPEGCNDPIDINNERRGRSDMWTRNDPDLIKDVDGKMQEFYITFGSGHLLGFGLRYYVKVIAPSEILVRKRINDLTDGKWSGVYKEVPNHGEHLLGTIIISDEYSWNTL